MPRKKVLVPKSTSVRKAVKILNVARKIGYSSVGPESLSDGYEAVFELIEQPWEAPVEGFHESVWREGYEQCMVDIVDAIADEWGVVVWTEEK